MNETYKVIGNINWIVQPGYPRLEEEESGAIITSVYICPPDKITEKLPSFGSSFYDDRFPYLNIYTDLLLKRRSVIPMSSGQCVQVTLTWEAPDLGALNTDGTMEESVEYISQELQIPVAQHSDYLANWNHKLLVKIPSSEAPSATFWNTAKTPTMSQEEAKYYKWAKPDDPVPDGYAVIYPEEIPGVEFYLTFTPEVQWTQISSDKTLLQRKAAQDGTKQSPPDAFNYQGQWLQSGSSIRRHGKSWARSVKFLGSKKWDERLYS
jgi:hypothetical protein